MAPWLRLVVLTGLVLRLQGRSPSAPTTSSPLHLLDDGTDELEYEQGGASSFELVVRATMLSLLFAPCTALALPAYIIPPFRRQVFYPLLSYTLAQGGPAFIKWGQWAATRPDMFPESLCYALEALQSNAPSHSFSFSKRQVEAALNAPLDEIFQHFEMKPVASGSIAQVHRAVLRPGAKGPTRATSSLVGGGEGGDAVAAEPLGPDVAVKVRHPGVAKRMRIDFALMKVVGQTIDNLPGLKWTQLGASLEQFGHTLSGQTRLDVEGGHLEDFNRNFNTWRPSVGFPQPIIQTETVLVESWEPGILISDYLERHKIRQREEVADRERRLAIAAANGTESSGGWLWSGTWGGMYEAKASPPKSRKEWEIEKLLRHPSIAHFILQRGEDIYLKMLLKDNLMHADLHPGNILVSTSETRDNKRESGGDSKPGTSVANADGTETDDESAMDMATAGRFGLQTSLILVDAGMVAELTRMEQDNFIGLLSALGDGDGFRAALALLRMSDAQPGCDTVRQQEAFAADVMEFFSHSCKGYDTGVDVGGVLRGLLGILRRHSVRIDSNYATLTMNVLCIESLAKKLEPAYNTLDGAKVLLRSYSKLCLAEGHSGVRTEKQISDKFRRLGVVRGGVIPRGPMQKLSVALGRAMFTAGFPVAQKARQYHDDRLFERLRRERFASQERVKLL